MSAYRVLTATANTPEWLRARKSVLGASEVACVLGLSKWSTPLGIYNDKLNPNITDDMTERQEWGHYLEEQGKPRLRACRRLCNSWLRRTQV